jgi:hypothetical protein
MQEQLQFHFSESFCAGFYSPAGGASHHLLANALQILVSPVFAVLEGC